NRKISDALQLHRLIDNLVGQLEDKNKEINSFQAISEKIISLKGIRDLVGAIVDVSKQLLDDVDVQFYPLNRNTQTLLDTGNGQNRIISTDLIDGKIIRKNNSSLSENRNFLTIFPLMIEGQVFGTLDIHSDSMLGEEKEGKILYLLNRSAERMENVALYEGLYENILSTLNSMAKILDARDPHTSQHSTRVTNFSMAMANVLTLAEDEKDVLYIAASLHDIGKVGIPDSILLKPGKLTEDEFKVIKRHPDIGADILKPIPPMIRETDVIRYHHERFDGKGYPSGLGGKEIPLLSRIIALADSYDAMTSDRPYRNGLPIDRAIEEIVRCTGTQFDPELATMFINKVIGA
ncbi:MAG TPA: HD-GYP domain-containing protein, partial [Desulfomonilia bacterium]|nr:HD-GYP domain-containing protein [Desulfomonilia bacterium]